MVVKLKNHDKLIEVTHSEMAALSYVYIWCKVMRSEEAQSSDFAQIVPDFDSWKDEQIGHAQGRGSSCFLGGLSLKSVN